MQEKVKTPKQPVKGFVTVELFDKYGDKIKTVRSHNIIRKQTKDHMRWKMKEDFFRGCPGTLPSEPRYCFNNIVLSTATTTPQESGLEDTGEIVGWANKSTYSGSDAHRGTINTSESYATNDKVHWVFDWPTHAANGTFQTILWGNIDTTGKTFLTEYYTLKTLGSIFNGITWGGGYYWLCDNSADKIHKMNSNYEIIESYNAPDSIPNGITWGGGFLWLSGANYHKIYKIDPSNMTVISSIPSPENIPQGLAWYDNSLWVTCGTSAMIKKLNPSTGAVLNTIITPVSDVRGFTFDNNGNIWVVDRSKQKVCKFNPNTSTILVVLYDTSGLPTDIVLNDDGTLTILRTEYSSYLIKHYDLQIGARTLLPQPVTKTSTNTMKVQYDFIFED